VKNEIKNKKVVDESVSKNLRQSEEFVQFIENSFDKNTVRKLKDFVVTLADPKSLGTPVFKELTRFGGDLSTNNFNNLYPANGVYNPEKIPYTVMARMMRDPQIAVGFSMLSEPIRALNWVVSTKDDYTKILVTEALAKIWNRFIKDTMLGVMYGAAVFEKVFRYEDIKVLDENKEGKIVEVFNDRVVIYDKLKNVHLSTIIINLDDKENFDGFTQTNLNGKIVRLPKEKAAIFTYDFKFGNYYGESLLRNVYKYWYWGELLYQFMLRYFEMCGSPPTLVIVPKGYTLDKNGNKKNNFDVGLDLGNALLSNSVAVLPFDPDKVKGNNMWDIKRLMDDKRGPMFIEAIAYINVMKLLGIFVPENVATQEISEKDVFFFTQEGMISSVQDFCDEQIIPPLIDYNISKDKKIPCNLLLDKMNYTRKTMLKEIFVEMIRSLRVLARDGVTTRFYPNMQQVAEQLEIPMTGWNEIFDRSNFVPNSKTERPGDVESDFDFEKTEYPKKGRGEAKKK